MPPNLIPTAEPFLFRGGPPGCLLVHGFTGTPREMRPMGEYLAGKGHAVLGLRLAGHATSPSDLVRTRWTDWVASLEDGWRLLNGLAQPVFLVGLSMGGALALLFASQRFAERYPVAGVIAISTIYSLPDDWRLPYLKLFQWIQPEVSKGPSDWQDQEAELAHIDYPTYPTRAVAELRDLLVEMRHALPEVNVPVLLVHSRQDRSVPPEHMQAIYDRVGTPVKEMLWVENCGHVVVCDQERGRVFQAAHEFMCRISPQDK